MGLTRQGRKGEGAESGFSLLELVVVIAIISVLISFAIHRLLVLQAAAERAAMESVRGTLQSALGLKVAEALIRHETAGLRALEGSNPMDQLAQLPANYLGVLSGAEAARLERGNWYFDADARALVYLVRGAADFRGGLPAPARARFGVRLVYADRNGNGRFDRGVDEIQGLRLEPLEPYAWVL